MLIGAGLLAMNAVKKGVFPKPHVKTSFAPGSKVVVDYVITSYSIHYTKLYDLGMPKGRSTRE